MKKRITVFVVLIMTMVLCLALTGCGQKTDKQEATTTNDRPGENFDTGRLQHHGRDQQPRRYHTVR